ncbi:MAG: MFS transporter [Rhizobiales bacterium]|nr:MFS transporter [Hyphomicrobiales bacterium]
MTAIAYESAAERRGANVARLFVIATISFLTLVDLFATQAILPSLARAYDVSPAMMGTAVNLCTAGMAAAGLLVALFNKRINRRWGVAASLALLAIPTALLALMPDLGTFAALRLIQGIFMSAAFSLTIAYLAENAAPHEVAAALAAYVTGNVASNLFGRLMSAAIADHLGLPANFAIFASLNLAGALVAFFALRHTRPMQEMARPIGEAAWTYAFRQRHLAASFGIGFLILFAFIGTFTYVNFVLVRPPLDLSPMQLGFVYFVFVPSIILTPLAGHVARRFGSRRTIIASLGLAALALPMLLAMKLALVLAGLALVAAGTFFAQATATGFVSRTAGQARGSAGGIYLASYYAGGLAGSIVLGRIFDQLGWPATVAAIAVSLVIGCLLALHLREPHDSAAISDS